MTARLIPDSVRRLLRLDADLRPSEPEPADFRPDLLPEIAARHAAADETPFEVEAHTHGQRGCRCLSCDVTTGFLISVGVDCDETPEAPKTYDGGCLVDVLTYQQATSLVSAHADRGWLLAEVTRLRAAAGEG